MKILGHEFRPMQPEDYDNGLAGASIRAMVCYDVADRILLYEPGVRPEIIEIRDGILRTWRMVYEIGGSKL